MEKNQEKHTHEWQKWNYQRSKNSFYKSAYAQGWKRKYEHDDEEMEDIKDWCEMSRN